LKAVPQRSQTRLRRGRIWAADPGLMMLPSDSGILPCCCGGFNMIGRRAELRQGSSPQPLDATPARQHGNIFHSWKT
jgi:hypothetical protein